MFGTLVASRPTHSLHLGDVSLSATVHTVLIALAVYASAHVVPMAERAVAEKLIFAVPEAKPEPAPEPPPPPTARDVAVVELPAKGFQVLTAPIVIPTEIPPIDVTRAVTDAADFSGRGVEGGVAKGVVGGRVLDGPAPDQPYFEFQVEKAVMSAGGCVPRYPDVLRSAEVQGEVLAQFVVDAQGRAELATFTALRSSHDLFTAAVRRCLPEMKFLPAEVGGRAVKQLVQQPYQFMLQK
jgi:periplasmic protein TonB